MMSRHATNAWAWMGSAACRIVASKRAISSGCRTPRHGFRAKGCKRILPTRWPAAATNGNAEVRFLVLPDCAEGNAPVAGLQGKPIDPRRDRHAGCGTEPGEPPSALRW